ncbi:ribonuclease HII [Ruminiclostridium cellulolyticum]|uniref:Ribonuclease HII n=1 Tax=Ruminiclostridium cellulolyticum (strain ATCC 35319 / DSM 5812 / JCM 6584 / H10) TaxID=394503 RepID=RNH2_RUMCH|nr:ribonuclease HII [Ruminiclostridium cellulolyticum]B8I7T9.1 RecName: Full=Ribonuclease HII; Short=RNase HII [Ruminiclostridium cellulolyticum H10]ACL75096.1 ribonuclease HII/HIII [Ruminiclostridium cellulolyticum H10]
MGTLTLKQIQEEAQKLSIQEAIEYLSTLHSTGFKVDKLLEKYYRLKNKHDREMERLQKMLSFERQAISEGFNYIAGVDEAGRGPLAGPVVAAAVVLPNGLTIEGINDSKKLSESQREKLFSEIKEKALSYGISVIDEKYIDEVNILNATKRAMTEALSQLEPTADCILLDAVRLDNISTKQVPIIKGDSLSLSIAAASILAKVTRDRLLTEYDAKYPQYGFAAHKGYGTPQHISAIKKFGLCPIHRLSFVKNFVE